MDENLAKNKPVPNLIKYFLGFLGVMMAQEILIQLLTGIDSILTLIPFIFMPAVALFFSLFCGFTGKGLDRIAFYVFLVAVYIFYVAQLIYHKIFGSFFSVSMVGVGPAAITNFHLALRAAIIENIPLMLLLLIPDIVCIAIDIVFSVVKKKELFNSKLTLLSRGVCFALIVPVWFAGVGILRITDTGNRSAYAVYTNSLTDTDTSAGKLGVLATSILEAKAFFFGGASNGAAEIISGSTENDDLEVISNLIAQLSSPTPVLSPTEAPTPTLEPTEALTATPDPSAAPTEAQQSYYSWCYDEIDFEKLADIAEDEEIKALCEYFATIEPTNKNEYTGLFEGYNLVYICAEAFWTYAANEKATPTLYKLANNGIVLSNFYNSFLNTTVNGEFAFATGLWPDVSRKADNGRESGSFACTAENLMPFGLGNLFADQLGANSYAFHNYYGAYYARYKTWPNLGYTTKFMDAGDGNGGMVFSSDWITSDLEMMEQAVDDFINEDTFHAYFMTFSGHGPYNGREVNPTSYNANSENNIEFVREVMGDTMTDDQALYYLAANVELDKALEYLINRLEEAGKLDKTVIVLTGDHFPYYIDYSQATKDALAGQTLDKETEIYKSTCIIYNSGLTEPIVNDSYCCTVDILPTILNLFNIKYDSRLLAGHDVFSDAMHKAVLYNKSFVTDFATYYTVKDKTTWHMDTSEIAEDTLENYVSSVCSIIDKEYAASLQIVNTDFYRFVWENTFGTGEEPGDRDAQGDADNKD